MNNFVPLKSNVTQYGPEPFAASTGTSYPFRLSTLFSFVGAALRRDPRFATLCARVGLVDYWCQSQNWPDCVDEVKAVYDFRAACENAAAKPVA